ncbi:MAG: glycosyltransferase [Clostridium sp.]|jgi:glycosyltransferase involved in cell wall biosynthesis|nr:glycosyltransferase [Clostridium sp.]
MEEKIQPLVSLVIPVYNTENDLRQCLDSAAVQSHENLEVLLVDDGSADGSAEICADFAGRDPRFRLYRQPHSGVSAARNFGLEQCAGEYVCFMDSDDWIDADFISTLLKTALGHDADAVICRIQDEYKTRQDKTRTSPSWIK